MKTKVTKVEFMSPGPETSDRFQIYANDPYFTDKYQDSLTKHPGTPEYQTIASELRKRFKAGADILRESGE